MVITKWLFYIGFGFIALGLLAYLFHKIGIPLGRLPGDIAIKKEKYGIYFPIVTSIVVSIILTVLVNLFLWLSRK